MNETQQFMCYLLTSQYGAEWEKMKEMLKNGHDFITHMQDKKKTLECYCTQFECTKQIYNGLSEEQKMFFLCFLSMQEERLKQEGMGNEEVIFNLRMLAYVYLPCLTTTNN